MFKNELYKKQKKRRRNKTIAMLYFWRPPPVRKKWSNCHLLQNPISTEYKVGLLIVAWLKVDKNVSLKSAKIKQLAVAAQ